MQQAKEVQGPENRLLYLCQQCQLLFSAKQDFPSAELEKAHYMRHENTVSNAGYVQFLNKAIVPALPFLHAGMRGLDYGCGPGPSLSVLLRERGYVMDDYDPFFFPYLKEDQVYDFIFSTECFEHFFDPDAEMQRLSLLLKTGGFLIVMTQLWQNLSELPTWYYAKDPTHVVFYHLHTFDWIAKHYGFEVKYTDSIRVIILKKLD
ncbi:class I SAM-dependent methyltransferase [uncultured Pontibacter sp.]|uniref:class I SAM-dependent methyltransferase n=1 Tax=uncultured Pontibacter sp. TaxID=453356 RepID=UPI00261A4C0D|nr:class I SAM-dependent methyltransferase [uncultured Pontibacter sp.]